MRPLRLAILPLFALAGCGSAPAPAAPPATPASTAASTAPASVECLPVELRSKPLGQRPPSVEEVGTLVMQAKPTCTLEVHDAAGVAKGTRPCPPDNDLRILDVVNGAVCELGGELAWMDSAGKKDGLAVIHAGRYAKHDEAADLALICAPFATVAQRSRVHVDSPDPFQKAAIRGDVLEASLTSPRWRRWFHELFAGGHRNEAALGPLRDAAQASHIACEAEWLTSPPPTPAP